MSHLPDQPVGPAQRVPQRTARRRVAALRPAAVVAALASVPLAWATWVGVDGWHARVALQAAVPLVDDLERQVTAGDRAGAAHTLARLQDRSRAAYAATHGPHWAAAGALPWVGVQVDAVQAVSEVVDGLATSVLPSLMGAAGAVDPASLAPRGQVDLSALQAAAPRVLTADADLHGAAQRLAAVDSTHVVDQVAAPLALLRGRVDDLSAVTATAARAVQLLPAMLGADGPREYLLLVQNNAEPRATGGIPGTVVRLRADAGAVTVVDQRAGGSMGGLPEPVLPLTAAESALFGSDLAADMRDVTFTPDFPRSAQIARTIFAQRAGTTVDGVLSVDPGALALVLGATGPVPLAPGPAADVAGGLLTADNAVPLLLNSVYLVLEDPADQDAFFADTASRVFAAVTGGQGDPRATVDALAEAARQGRLMVWSAHEPEQRLLVGTVLSGELRGSAGASPVVGVYLNDGSQAKMGYYLQTDVGVAGTTCHADGSRTTTVTVTLTNTAPEPASHLPAYVTGTGGLPVGDVRTNVLLYAPEGGQVETVRVLGGEPGVMSQSHHGLAVVGRTTQLSPGRALTLEYDVALAPGHPGAVRVRMTPLAQSTLTYTGEQICS